MVNYSSFQVRALSTFVPYFLFSPSVTNLSKMLARQKLEVSNIHNPVVYAGFFSRFPAPVCGRFFLCLVWQGRMTNGKLGWFSETLLSVGKLGGNLTKNGVPEAIGNGALARKHITHTNTFNRFLYFLLTDHFVEDMIPMPLRITPRSRVALRGLCGEHEERGTYGHLDSS